MFVILTSCVDAGDEGSYDGNVIGTFVGIVDRELTKQAVEDHTDGVAARSETTPIVTITRHPHDSSYRFMATLSYDGYEVYYHYQAVYI